MSRLLEIYDVCYVLRSENVLKHRFCLAFNHCHSVQVLIRSLVSEGVELDDIVYQSSHYIKTYR